jgi:hypothetical protein
MMAGPAGADARGLLGPCAVVDWLGDDGERDGGRHGGGGGGHGAAKRRTISPLASICATASKHPHRGHARCSEMTAPTMVGAEDGKRKRSSCCTPLLRAGVLLHGNDIVSFFRTGPGGAAMRPRVRAENSFTAAASARVPPIFFLAVVCALNSRREKTGVTISAGRFW